MKLFALATTLASAAALAACADYGAYDAPLAAAPAYVVDAAAVAPAGGCFFTRDIRNHTVGDDRTLYVDVAGRDVYRVEMSNACLSSANFDPLVIRNMGGSSSVCRPIDLDIGVSGPAGSSHCIVSNITRLTANEIEALPAKLRP